MSLSREAPAWWGGPLVRALEAARHEPVLLARSEGIDLVSGEGLRRLVEAGSVPVTVVRATEFHDFAAMVVSWTRPDDSATVPPLLVQPVAIDDVVQLLIEVATGPPGQGRLELAGPKTEDLVDMARRTLAARGGLLRSLCQKRNPHSSHSRSSKETLSHLGQRYSVYLRTLDS